MSNRTFFLVCGVLVALTRCTTKQVSQEVPNQPPNIIVILADDLGYGDLSCFGHPEIKTPTLDKLANEGAKLTNFYAASPACSASRYGLLTGKYPARSGFDWVLFPNASRGLHPRETTIAQALKKEGYATAIFGKWHLGSTNPSFMPNQHGFDTFVGLPYSHDMLPPVWDEIPLLQNSDTLALHPDQNTLTELFTNKAIDFIKNNKSNPFFLYLPYSMPHVPLSPGAAYAGRSKRGAYGDVVEEIDGRVGQIIEALQNHGLSENTLVLFTSDNGPWTDQGAAGGSSGLLKDGKGSTWEGGVRVPGIVWWPEKVPGNQILSMPVSSLDVFNTILDAVQSEQKIKNDGISFMPLLKGDEAAYNGTDRSLVYNGLHNQAMAIRKGDWKLHVTTYSQSNQVFYDTLPLLFNLPMDPAEQYNLANHNIKKVLELQVELQNYQEAIEQNPNYFMQDRKQELQEHMLLDRLPLEMSIADNNWGNVTNGILEEAEELEELPVQEESLLLTYDLKSERDIESIEARFLRNQLRWVFLPTFVEFQIAGENKHFETVATFSHQTVKGRPAQSFKDFEVELEERARYIRIKAENYGKLPVWHKAHGNKSLLVASEIIVE